MYYYQFNIGDYKTHTSHLTPIEDIAYRRLLDWYYLHECPVPLDIKHVSRLIMMTEYSTDVERVLNEFYTVVESGWINKRCDIEISAFHSKINQASKAGKKSAEARKANKINNPERTFNQPRTKNHKPRTKNQEPILKTPSLPAKESINHSEYSYNPDDEVGL